MTSTKQPTDRELFAQWKRGEGPAQTSPERRKLFVKLAGSPAAYRKAMKARHTAKHPARKEKS